MVARTESLVPQQALQSWVSGTRFCSLCLQGVVPRRASSSLAGKVPPHPPPKVSPSRARLYEKVTVESEWLHPLNVQLVNNACMSPPHLLPLFSVVSLEDLQLQAKSSEKAQHDTKAVTRKTPVSLNPRKPKSERQRRVRTAGV